MRVVILGCGPAGLVAAHTAYSLGADFTILANRQKSKLYGCQYLHGPVLGIGAQSTRVRYLLRGSTDGYRRKVYGDSWEGKVSPEDLGQHHRAWDIRQAYDSLWSIYGDFVRQCHITTHYAARLVADFDLVISSIPAYVVCSGNHNFHSRLIRADGSAPWKSDMPELSDNTVICDGNPAVPWYRASKVFGHSTIEWPEDGDQGVLVRKPLTTDCDCLPQILRVGRYGAWDKSKLVHQVAADVTEALR
jgi:hypothetical protein